MWQCRLESGKLYSSHDITTTMRVFEAYNIRRIDQSITWRNATITHGPRWSTIYLSVWIEGTQSILKMMERQGT